MARFIDLLALEGPEKGMRFTIEGNTYRVLVRASDEAATTQQMTLEGDRLLDKEQEQLLDEVLAQRPGLRTQFKKRGPDIVLRDGSVSRTHALVFVESAAVSVVDLMSTNGTKVNGNLVRDIDVKQGDVIQIGNSKLTVEDG